MNSFWTTLIEINLILSVVYTGYIILLKNLTFFRWTRVYLLGGMLTGLVYPFLKIQRIIPPPAEGFNIVIPDISQVSQVQSYDYSQWIVYTVSATFLLLSLRFLIRFFSLGEIHFASDRAEFNGRKFRNTHQQVNPFSFWKWIYIHRESHSDFEMNQIMAHEYIHTRERHTLDVLVAEICTVVCWYNPLVRLLSKAVKDNLEFLTDAEVLYSGIDKISYQHSLVGISLSGFPQPRHGNHFAFKTLKRRIYMMNKEQSPKSRLMAYILITPLLLALAGLLTVSCQKEALDTIAKAKKSEGIVLERPITAGHDKDQKKTVVEGVALKSAGTVEGIHFEADQKKTVVEGVELKLAGRVEGIHFEAKSMEMDKQGSLTLNSPTLIRTPDPLSEQPLWILDGKPIDKDQISQINANSIESVSVLKDKASTALYGEKGKNGVILIVTKNDTKTSRQ